MVMRDELSPGGMMALVWSFTGVSILLTIGRQALRHTMRTSTSRHRLEDLFHGIAQALLIGFAATFTAWLRYDLAAHSKINTLGGTGKVSRPHIMIHYQIAIAPQFLSVMYFVKFTFLVLYRSIFNISQGFMRAWWVVVVCTVVSYLMAFLSVFWICSSPRYVFNVEHCMAHKSERHGVKIITMGACLNVFTDIAVMALPLSMLRTLVMPPKQKFGLAAVFLLGLVGLAFDIIRIWHTVYVQGKGSWAIWDVLEPCLAVIASALPPYKILLANAKAAKRASAGNSGNPSPKASQPSSQSSEGSEGSEATAASAGTAGTGSTKRASSDPYGRYWYDVETVTVDDDDDDDDEEKKVEAGATTGVTTTVRPVLNPTPQGSAVGAGAVFREEDVQLNAFDQV